MTIRADYERAGEPHIEFIDWIDKVRIYARDYYGSDIELGTDEDMRPFYNDAFDPETAVDEVFRAGTA